MKVDRVSCPADYQPSGGLSGDRATATAQAVAECARRAGVTLVTTDRTLPFIFAWHLQQAGIAVDYSADLGVLDRRVKDEQELEWLAAAQQATEAAMLMACQTVARATANRDGSLMHDGAALTSERLRKMISVYLLDLGYGTPHDSIVASTPHSADCHERGSGPLYTGQSVIVDIFPRSLATSYWGDCTRSVVHGDVSDEMKKMHAAAWLMQKRKPHLPLKQERKPTMFMVQRNRPSQSTVTHLCAAKSLIHQCSRMELGTVSDLSATNLSSSMTAAGNF